MLLLLKKKQKQKLKKHQQEKTTSFFFKLKNELQIWKKYNNYMSWQCLICFPGMLWMLFDFEFLFPHAVAMVRISTSGRGIIANNVIKNNL